MAEFTQTKPATHTQLKAFLWLMALVLIVVICAAWLGQKLSQLQSSRQAVKPAAVAQIEPSSSIPPAALSQNTVVKIIDGDTFRLASGETVRYIGINAPEVQHGKKPAECFGIESTQLNSNLILNKEVRLEMDQSPKDQFGRLLRYVWLDNQLINLVLIERGAAVAKAYPPDIAHKAEFASASARAKQLKVGLWGACPN